MILSRDASTSVFAAGGELQELSRTGFYTGGPTICVGEILGHTRVVQVHTRGMRTVNAAGRETHAVEFDQSQPAVFAEVADPFVLVRTRAGEISMYEASPQSGRLEQLPVDGFVKGRLVAAASLFVDTHHVLGSNKEWAEHNSDMLARLDPSADGGAALGEAFDSLYADAPALRKRKRARDHTASGRRRRGGEGSALDDLYDEDGGERPVAGDGGAVQSGAGQAARGRQPDEDARSEAVGGRAPVFLLLALA
ncbi:mRNA cleavage and polyadenylation factor subunit, partial [Coemansia nantahalensis]